MGFIADNMVRNCYGIDEMNRPIINPTIKSFLFPLAKDEYALLEEGIVREGGAVMPLIVWKETGELVDGHNRLEICEKHGLPYSVIDRSYDSIEAALIDLIKIQLGRRNINTYQAGVMALELDRLVHITERAAQNKADMAREQVLAQSRKEDGEFVDGMGSCVNSTREHIDRAEVLGEAVGIGRTSMARIISIEDKASRELKVLLATNEIGLDTATRFTKAVPNKKEQARILAKDGMKGVREIIQKSIVLIPPKEPTKEEIQRLHASDNFGIVAREDAESRWKDHQAKIEFASIFEETLRPLIPELEERILSVLEEYKGAAANDRIIYSLKLWLSDEVSRIGKLPYDGRD